MGRHIRFDEIIDGRRVHHFDGGGIQTCWGQRCQYCAGERDQHARDRAWIEREMGDVEVREVQASDAGHCAY